MFTAESVSPSLSHWPADTSLPLPAGSIGDCLRQNAARWPDRPALLLMDGDHPLPISHCELLQICENLARWLGGQCQQGDRIALWSRNAFEAVVLQHACALAGTIIVPFNTGWSDSEAAHALELTTPSLLFVGLGNRGDALISRATALASCPVLPLDDVAVLARSIHSAVLPAVTQDAPYLIQFTSGTTGKAKGALLSQRAALLGGWLRPMVDGCDETDLWLNAVPFHHIGGSCAIILGALTTASPFVVLEGYDRDQLVRLMRQLGPTRMGGVPTMWHDILASPDLPPKGTVRTVTLGGASVPPGLVHAVRDRLGAVCVIGYGQSECPVATATLRDAPIEEICNSIGRALPHVEIKVVDLAGETVPWGVTGEICVRGPIIMNGYWNNPEATRATIGADGFLHTGDLGAMDRGGVVRIMGRLRDVIIRGGENIYPAEIEAALLSHPAVAMAAVVGVEHERLGQEVGAVIQLRPGTNAGEAELEAHVSERIARFKTPRHWRFVEAMPLTVSGKVRKVELEEMFR